MNFNNKRGSFKRSREELPLNSNQINQDKEFSRPLKRSSSPTLYSSSNSNSNSTINLPKTPEKSRHVIGKRNKLLTSFKKAFSSKNDQSSSSSNVCQNVFQSPISDDEDSKSTTSSILSSQSNSPCPSPTSQFNFQTPPSSPLNFNKSLTLSLDKPCHDFSFDDNVNNLHISNLSLTTTTTTNTHQCHEIFQIPEIVSKIISFVDLPFLPHEESPIRRRPLSYQHALLIYKDESKAQRVWNDAMESSTRNQGNPETKRSVSQNNLYGCLLVNKLWYNITLEISTNKLFFTNESKWLNFVNKTRKTPKRKVSNTSLFIMHKITKAKQEDLEIVAPSISGNLEWIEMYICPKILPTFSMLQGSLLKKLILPGSKIVNDEFITKVSLMCPKLEILDLRACELISDNSIVQIAQNCSNLINLNLGRHLNGHLITDNSLINLSRNTKIQTLGMAGCAITDRGVWELAINCSDSLQRLSINNCYMLTNLSLPSIFQHGYFHNVSVLEIRKLLNLTNFKSILQYQKAKQSQGEIVLIEGCEVLELRMRQEEWRYEMKRSSMILNDVFNWANDENDGDVPLSYLVMN
ncbi:Antagonist of mitotic exit network protein 1 [Wickerhamomyces ciferrii]|uniref:Antagonist of mitotic exit network protein 1 n=1 Tax=Wickerhamomyces ciferrii (strain ATCC 14091 / BCRC 22168 / CBS 111 / JCM 3599 / NBRC 0793 / NRRL Y-1031 F-60-10) TaxID=1206466 RepID=K0KLX4_WICCF|nr:Antagonist of mitotic exit network protein 1 [Wickerhamomyces ciferrii]CCH42344.1 Antagonist of mitotic exit network protein 1 [Wickerhamomyces ciferrii]